MLSGSSSQSTEYQIKPNDPNHLGWGIGVVSILPADDSPEINFIFKKRKYGLLGIGIHPITLFSFTIKSIRNIKFKHIIAIKILKLTKMLH